MSSSEFDQIKDSIPYQSPIEPVELTLDSEIQFHCHKNIACFNACCKNIDITITPYDIRRLKTRFGLTSSQWVNRYTVPFSLDAHDLPGLKLMTQPGSTACVFLTAQGCSVYEDRPNACRYYALGSMGVRRTGAAVVDDLYFLVKEPHCLGHNEPRRLTVREYLAEQGIDEYDRANRPWRDILLKKRSSGPTLGQPSVRSRQLFDMCSYDIDHFRRFIQSDGFREVVDLAAGESASLIDDDDKLFEFSCRFLRQVLFGEQSIAIKTEASATRATRRRDSATAADAD